MERYAHAVHLERLTVSKRLNGGVAHASANDMLAGGSDKVVPVTDARVVAVAVRDDRTVYRRPRIDVETAGSAVQPFRRNGDEFQRVLPGNGLTSAASPSLRQP
jgi:hypothetical protein